MTPKEVVEKLRSTMAKDERSVQFLAELEAMTDAEKVEFLTIAHLKQNHDIEQIVKAIDTLWADTYGAHMVDKGDEGELHEVIDVTKGTVQ